jgi:ComF family protein
MPPPGPPTKTFAHNRARRCVDSALMLQLESARSLLFVPHCPACDERVAAPTPLCAPCAISLDELGPACPRCAEPQAAPPPVTCARCRTSQWPLEALVAPWRYGGELGRALRRMKFARRPDLARDLAALYAPFFAATVDEGAIDLIVPVPLHWRRLAGRGFNQADALARHGRRAAEVTTRMDALVLRRIRATPPQTSLDGPARLTNLDGAFEVPPRRARRVVGRRILLVDDVVATGATMAAAGHALKKAGAAAVVGFAVARA